MNWKRPAALALSLSLAAALAAPALAAPEDDPAGGSGGLPEGAAWYDARRADDEAPVEETAVPIPAAFAPAVTVNGQPLSPVTFENVDENGLGEEVTMAVEDLPGAPAGYLPMRMLCAADPQGYASWIAQENSAVFALNGNSFIVYFSDLSVERDGEKVEGVRAYLSEGVTFLPAAFLSTLEGVEIDGAPELDVERYDVVLTTDPLVQLVRDIQAETGVAGGMEVSLEELSLLAFTVDNLTRGAGCLPLRTSPDTILVVQVKEGAMEAVKGEMEAYRAGQEQTFTWYLPQHLPKTQSARIVSVDDYALLFIGENEDKAVETFEAGVAALTAAQD